MKTPGDWALMWANNHVNKMTWGQLVTAIRAEAIADVCRDIIDNNPEGDGR